MIAKRQIHVPDEMQGLVYLRTLSLQRCYSPNLSSKANRVSKPSTLSIFSVIQCCHQCRVTRGLRLLTQYKSMLHDASRSGSVGRVLDLGSKGRRQSHCVVSLSKTL